MSASASSGRTERRATILFWVAIFGLVAAYLGALIGFMGPELRCLAQLDPCDEPDSSQSAQPGQSSISPAGESPSVGSVDLDEPVDAPADPSLPYLVSAPEPQASPGTYPHASLSFDSLTNQGEPVEIPISGGGFSTSSTALIDWYTPDGSTYLHTGVETDDRGLWGTTLLWYPLQYLGIDGNDGGWRLVVTDATSGKSVDLQLTVRSDADTPEPSQWGDPNDLEAPSVPADLSVGSSGTLCEGPGVITHTYATGFAPNAGLRLDYLRPDGQRVGMRTLLADGAGELSLIQDYWSIGSCESGIEFEYTFVLTDTLTRRSDTAQVLLSTNE